MCAAPVIIYLAQFAAMNLRDQGDDESYERESNASRSSHIEDVPVKKTETNTLTRD